MPRRRRAVLRALVLAAACAALSFSLSGCVYFSNGFWPCLATKDGRRAKRWRATSQQTPNDTDGDGTSNTNDAARTLRRARKREAVPTATATACADDAIAARTSRVTMGSGCPTPGPPPQDTTPPAAPTGLRANVVDASVFLNWDDNSESDLAGYTVEHATTPGGPYTALASHRTSSQYVDQSPTPGTNYYIVTADDRAGNISARSAEVSALFCPPGLCLASASRARSYRATVTGGIVSKGTLSVRGREPDRPRDRVRGQADRRARRSGRPAASHVARADRLHAARVRHDRDGDRRRAGPLRQARHALPALHPVDDRRRGRSSAAEGQLHRDRRQRPGPGTGRGHALHRQPGARRRLDAARDRATGQAPTTPHARGVPAGSTC